MKQFEYKSCIFTFNEDPFMIVESQTKMRADRDAWLSAHGKEGWEPIKIDYNQQGTFVIFKREVNE